MVAGNGGRGGGFVSVAYGGGVWEDWGYVWKWGWGCEWRMVGGLGVQLAYGGGERMGVWCMVGWGGKGNEGLCVGVVMWGWIGVGKGVSLMTQVQQLACRSLCLWCVGCH